MICSKCGLADRYNNGRCRPCNKAKVKAWSIANKERKKSSVKAWQTANAETKKEKERLRRLANPEREAANKKSWAIANYEKKKDYDANWRKKNPEKRKEARKKWEQGNAEKVRAKNALRRKRKYSSNAEIFDPFEIFERDKWMCHLCGIGTLKIKRGTTHSLAPELDHIIPLSRGGLHTRDNTACSCRKCNGSKGNRIVV